MSLPEGSKGGTFLCPTCRSPLTITIGGPAPSQPSPTQTTWQSLPPPVKPSAQATQVGGQVWREATEQFVDAEQRRLREDAKRYEGRNSTSFAGSSSRPPRRQGSSSMLSGCLVAGGVIGGLAALAGIGIVVALMFFGGPTELSMEGYKVVANGSRKMERSEGDRRTVAVENRFTKSGFLIVVREFPMGVMVDLNGYIENLRGVGLVTESRPIEKAGLIGIRYRFRSSSASSPPHIGEIFSIGNKALIVMYIPGDEFLRLQGRKSRYSTEQQNKVDDPEDFFASFQKAN
jgi:hypothetical protein